MVHLKPGYGLDSDGFIVSDVSLDKIDAVYLPCIQEAVKEAEKLFSNHLHSVYVYGSVARGDAIKSKSDLDLLILFHGRLEADRQSEVKKFAEWLSNKYQSLVREVGITVAFYEEMIDPQRYYENAFIKEICVCVHGEDVGNQFGPYKLTPEIAIWFNGDIGDVLTRTLNRMKAASDEEFKRLTQNFSRKLIRTYYSMVMARSQIWTTRLQEQAAVFLDYFPKKEVVVRSFLKWVDQPPTNRQMVYELFEKEGKWATENFKQEAQMR